MGEHAATVDDMAAQLQAAVLQVQGNKGSSEWSKLHGKLAELAAGVGGDDPTTAVKALLDVAKDASSSQALMRALEERVSKANLKTIVSLVAHELTMTPLGDSDINFCIESVDGIVKCSAELSAPDAPYAVISSVVGAQSIGKSFSLNRLFGTRFPEMDGLGRRCQTARGCIEPSLIPLDVEGFDASEKNQIIKDDSRELIHMAQGHTLEKFKHEFDGKNIKDMKMANAYISKCVDEFMSSFKDLKLVDSKYLQNIGEELEKNLEAHADKKIKERERKAKQRRDRILKSMNVGMLAVATTAAAAAAVVTGDVVTPTVYAGKLVQSAVDLSNHNSEMASTSQDDHCD